MVMSEEQAADLIAAVFVGIALVDEIEKQVRYGEIRS